jgi:hypothetical protein
LIFRLVGFDHSNQFRGYQTASKRRLVHEEQNVERITIVAPGRRDVAEVKRKTLPTGSMPDNLNRPSSSSYLNLFRLPFGVSTTAFTCPDSLSNASSLIIRFTAAQPVPPTHRS